MQHPYCAYLLLCADHTYYTGFTSQLEKQVAEHLSGLIPGCYTHNRRPVQLVYYETFPSLEAAEKRAVQWKKWSKAKKKALAESNFHELHLLAACRNITHYKYKDIRQAQR
jgi:putative endonuclease